MCCSQVGATDAAFQVWHMLRADGRTVPNVRTFTELIGTCCKAGALDAAFGLLYQMTAEVRAGPPHGGKFAGCGRARAAGGEGISRAGSEGGAGWGNGIEGVSGGKGEERGSLLLAESCGALGFMFATYLPNSRLTSVTC